MTAEIKLAGSECSVWFFKFFNETQTFEWNPKLIEAFLDAVEKETSARILEGIKEREAKMYENFNTNHFKEK